MSEKLYPPVLTKRDFVRRFRQGEFGNAGPVWDTPRDFIGVPLGERKGLYHLRNRVAGGSTHYNLTYGQALDGWRDTADYRQWYVSEMAPTEKTLIQGEVLETEKGLTLLHSRIAKPMREALAESSQSVSGIIAVSLLRSFLCPNSYDWLMTLLERYEGHVVEFSTYDTCWGTLPNFNSIFWEVRSY